MPKDLDLYRKEIEAYQEFLRLDTEETLAAVEAWKSWEGMKTDWADRRKEWRESLDRANEAKKRWESLWLEKEKEEWNKEWEECKKRQGWK